MNHLWQSTVFAAVAGLLTLAFRRNRAQVRYWLWFCASCKFLVPFALLMSLGRLVPVRSSTPLAAHVVSVAVEQIAQPFPETPTFTPRSRHSVDSIDWLPIVWTSGFAAVVWVRFRGWLRVRAAVRASTPIDIDARFIVRSTPGLLEPGVVGWWRPTLLLPAGIFERLTSTQLEAVLAHELCHVRRRDNLLAAVHMIVEALFWFHPMVWWIGARLVEERERACDEEVLRLGSAPHDYAEAIVNVCKLYVESPLACVAGVTGADIKRRIEAIMSNRMVLRLNFAKKAALAIAAVVALAAPIAVGILKAPIVRGQSTGPKFEVASIKLCAAGESGGRSGKGEKNARSSPGRLDLACETVTTLVKLAYVGGRASVPISGGPAWIDSDRYRIDAKAEEPENTEKMIGPMLQALLENRFQLKIHRDSREAPVYEMTVARGGPKLQPAAEGGCISYPAKTLVPRPTGQKLMPCGFFFGKKKDAPGIFTVNTRGMSLTAFADNLSLLMDRPVIDKTGLTGMFDLYAEFIPDESTPGLLGRKFFAAPDGTPSEPGPSMIAALQQQLGLKLEPAKGPREFLIIDHVERPSEN
jgi:bla regulator protein BlaR1